MNRKRLVFVAQKKKCMTDFIKLILSSPSQSVSSSSGLCRYRKLNEVAKYILDDIREGSIEMKMNVIVSHKEIPFILKSNREI